MIGQSQSGTGKTAAFVLTMLSRVDFTKNKPQVWFHYQHFQRLLTIVDDEGSLSCPISRTGSPNHVSGGGHGQIHERTDRVCYQRQPPS
jgi:hypothetical protein